MRFCRPAASAVRAAATESGPMKATRAGVSRSS